MNATSEKQKPLRSSNPYFMTEQELLEHHKEELQKILYEARDEVSRILNEGKSDETSEEEALKIEQLRTALGVTE